MQRYFVGIMCLVVLSCASEKVITTNEKPGNRPNSSSVQAPDAKATETIADTGKGSTSLGVTVEPALDSAQLSAAVEILPDTLLLDSTQISEHMELARQHYLNAQSAQETGDTSRAENEFEQSIQI